MGKNRKLRQAEVKEFLAGPVLSVAASLLEQISQMVI